MRLFIYAERILNVNVWIERDFNNLRSMKEKKLNSVCYLFCVSVHDKNVRQLSELRTCVLHITWIVYIHNSLCSLKCRYKCFVIVVE